MKVSVIGLGVGATWAFILSIQDFIDEVVGVDIDPKMVESPRMEESVNQFASKYKEKIDKKVILTTDYSKIVGSEYVFLVVATKFEPEKGERSVEAAKASIKSIREVDKDAIIIVNSTLPFGGSEKLLEVCEKDKYVYMPLMVTQGELIKTFTNPRILSIGAYNENTGSKVHRFYLDVYENMFEKGISEKIPPMFEVTPEEAEMIKFVANAFLSMKITFANTVGDLCEKVGINANKVLRVAGSDPRIVDRFFKAGYAFGGDCFPQDLSAIIVTSKKHKFEPILFQIVENLNKNRVLYPLKVIEEELKNKELKLDLDSGLSIAILGLAYKAGITDIRGSPSMDLYNHLKKNGFNVIGYDPNLPNETEETLQEILSKVDVVIVVNPEQEFRNIGEILGEKCKIVCDVAGIVELSSMPKEIKFYKVGVGWI